MTKPSSKRSNVVSFPGGNSPLNGKPPSPAKLTRQYKALAKRLRKETSDELDLELLRYFLNLSLSLVPTAQECYTRYKNERAAYALNGIISQCREISNDIRSMRTGKKVHDHIIAKVIIPTLQLIVQQYITNQGEILTKIDAVKDKKAKHIKRQITKDMQQFGVFVDSLNKDMQGKLADYLNA